MIKTSESAATRVMMLTWEYPPKRLGNISDHVQTLSHELVKRGHEVEVLTEDDVKTGVEDISGVHVHRVSNQVKVHPMASILTFTMTASVSMEREASDVIYYYRHVGKKIDFIHAHEWLTVPMAISLKHAFKLPFILTLHSVEGHRCHDAFGPISIAISEIERMGINEATRVIANTEWMKNEILRYYGEEHGNKVDVAWPIAEDWVQGVINVYNEVLST